MTDRPLEGRIAVVTGASRGIGYVLAREIARAGAHVVAVARTVGGLEELDDEIRGFGGQATLVPVDLTDFDAIDRLGAALFERHGKLDVLVGNAGILGPVSPLGHVAPKDFDKVMAINVTANWRLIRSLDPLLRRSDAGRAVFLTSGAVHNIRAYWGPYAISKAALETMVVTWARETEITPVKVNLLNPGPIRTAMRAQAMPGEDAETLSTADVLVPAVLRLTAPGLDVSGRVWNHPTGDWLA